MKTIKKLLTNELLTCNPDGKLCKKNNLVVYNNLIFVFKKSVDIGH